MAKTPQKVGGMSSAIALFYGVPLRLAQSPPFRTVNHHYLGVLFTVEPVSSDTLFTYFIYTVKRSFHGWKNGWDRDVNIYILSPPAPPPGGLDSFKLL